MKQALAARQSKKQAIAEFFLARVGQRIGSMELHLRFGTAFRSRVSEINNDPEAAISIRNLAGQRADGQETSAYTAEWRVPPRAAREARQERLFG